jgi:hypothetical protein
MRKGRKILILILVLTAIIFISCGIPSYFYTETKYYSTEKITGTDNKFKITIKSHEGSDGDLGLVEDGPGLFLFYYISQDSSTASIDTKIKSAFKTKYQGSNYTGINPGNVSKGSAILSFNDSSEDFNWNIGAFCLDSQTVQSPPYFASNLSARTDGNIVFYFQAQFNESTNCIDLVVSEDETFDDSDDSVTLYRYNGNSFLTSKSEIRSNTKDDDYSALNSRLNSDVYYVHIFNSVSFQKGKFTNKFWTIPAICVSVPISVK